MWPSQTEETSRFNRISIAPVERFNTITNKRPNHVRAI